MIVSNTYQRVRYGEVDQMGFMYYGNYALYYEVGRSEIIRHSGYTYADMEKDGIVMPVVKLNCKYLRPAKYDDLIRIETTIKELPHNSFITFHHQLYNEANELLHKSEITLTFFDPVTQKRVPMPKQFYDFLSPYFT